MAKTQKPADPAKPAEAAADTLPVTSLTDPAQLTPATGPGQTSTDTPPPSGTDLNDSPGGEPTYGDVEPAPGTATSTPPSDTPPSEEAPNDTTGADAPELSEEELVSLVIARAEKDPSFAPFLLLQLDESTEPEQEEGIRSFVERYLKENQAYAHTLRALVVVPDSGFYEGSGTPTATPPDVVNPAPATEPEPPQPEPTPPVTTPAPEPTEGPQDSFPVDKVYGWGRAVKANFNGILVPGTISGIYFDSDGVSYEVAVHVKDAVPSYGTPAKQAKITVSAEFVSAQ